MNRLRLLSLIGVAAGAWLLAAPFVLHLPHVYPHQLAFGSSLVVGAAVLLLSALHGLQWETGRRAARINVSLGLLFAASPLLFGYGHAHGPGRTAAANAVIAGAVIVAGAALSLAGSGTDRPAAERPVQRAPALWSAPARGGQPQPFGSRADATTASESDQRMARAKLPLAWTAVATMIVGAVLVGLAVVLVSWSVGAVGMVLAAAGCALALRVRILSDVSLGQRPEGP